MSFRETQYPIRHFIDLEDTPKDDLRRMIDVAREVKQQFKRGERNLALPGKILAMIFEKHSTRTRVSFEVGIRDFGGHTITMNERDMQLGRGETIADTAKVLSRFVDCVVIRANSHQTVTDLAESGHIPVINGLTDKSHPCQLMADVLTFEEHRGPIAGHTLAWVGDGNNVAHSLIAAAGQFGFHLNLACPKELQPGAEIMRWANEQGVNVRWTTDPRAAVEGTSAVITDTWISMGDKDADSRMKLLAPYQVNRELMALADKDAIFLHCLPAHRGEEVTAEVIDGPQSVIWDEAENRLHAQKGVLLWCFKAI